MRERTSATGSEREQREELERLQAELKATRVALETASAEADRTAAALVTAIAEARARRDGLRALARARSEESARLTAELEGLEARLVEKRKEDVLLARGAKLRDVYVDWNPEDRRHAVGDGLTVTQVKWGAVLIGGLVLATMLWGSCR